MNKTLSKLNRAVLGATNLFFLNVLRVASAVKHGETVVFGGITFEAISVGTVSNPAFKLIDIASATVAGTGTLTISSSQNAAADETVTIGSRVYTWKAALTAANQVLIGADRVASAANLTAAINGSAGAGTTYGTGTVAHADVTAVAGTGTVALTSKAKGTVANSIATTETMSHGSFGAATLASGADASAANFTTALETAINAAGVKLLADRVSANEVLVIDVALGSERRSKPCSETLTGSNNAWAAADSFGGDTSINPPSLAIVSRVPTATEIALDNMHFAFPFVPTTATVQIRSSAGVLQAFDGSVVLGGNVVSIVSGGSVKVEASDIVTVTAAA